MPAATTIGVEEIMRRAAAAAAVFSQLDQEQTDAVARAAFEAGLNHRVDLAKLAAEETGLGRWQDKAIKNTVATLLVWEDIKNLKTVGIISDNAETGILEIAQPLGPILAVIPVTNPTSTVLFKIISALKTRNPIIIKPHHSASRSSIAAAKICYEAALAADAPEDCVQWVTDLSREETHALMSHKGLALILATGGGSVVHAAYSSGTPAMGVGAGNVPVFIERSADAAFAVEQIMLSKTFDNGTICSSEQAIVVESSVADKVIGEFKKRKAHFLEEDEARRLGEVAYDKKNCVMNTAVIGKPAAAVAQMAGIRVPPDTSVLVAPLNRVGAGEPLSSEILAPILAFYTAKDFQEAVNLCIELNYHGGIGHTACLFSNDEENIRRFAHLMNAGRILVNTPSSQGAVGGIFNGLNPSLTLGCGSGGKNITTDNVTARHLLNIQRIARRRVNDRFAALDSRTLLDGKINAGQIERDFHRNH